MAKHMSPSRFNGTATGSESPRASSGVWCNPWVWHSSIKALPWSHTWAFFWGPRLQWTPQPRNRQRWPPQLSMFKHQDLFIVTYCDIVTNCQRICSRLLGKEVRHTILPLRIGSCRLRSLEGVEAPVTVHPIDVCDQNSCVPPGHKSMWRKAKDSLRIFEDDFTAC